MTATERAAMLAELDRAAAIARVRELVEKALDEWEATAWKGPLTALEINVRPR